jgi:hypothetical protein
MARRLRLRIWTLMIFVGLVAVGMGGYAEYRRLQRLRQAYEFKAISHGESVYSWSEQIRRDRGSEAWVLWLMRRDGLVARKEMEGLLENTQRAIQVDRVWIDYHSEMTRKYSRAARYPFLPVAPDPPEPK